MHIEILECCLQCGVEDVEFSGISRQLHSLTAQLSRRGTGLETYHHRRSLSHGASMRASAVILLTRGSPADEERPSTVLLIILGAAFVRIMLFSTIH